MDFHYYPNDQQTCDIKFESFGYTTEYLKFDWHQMIDYVSDELTMKQFKMTAILQPPYVTDTYDLRYPGSHLMLHDITQHLLNLRHS